MFFSMLNTNHFSLIFSAIPAKNKCLSNDNNIRQTKKQRQPSNHKMCIYKRSNNRLMFVVCNSEYCLIVLTKQQTNATSLFMYKNLVYPFCLQIRMDLNNNNNTTTTTTKITTTTTTITKTTTTTITH